MRNISDSATACCFQGSMLQCIQVIMQFFDERSLLHVCQEFDIIYEFLESKKFNMVLLQALENDKVFIPGV